MTLRQHDPVDMPKLSKVEHEAAVTSCGNEMAEIRKEYAASPYHHGKVAALRVRYRRLAHMWWQLTETEAPKIWSDM